MPEGILSPDSLGASDETLGDCVKQRRQATAHLQNNSDVMSDNSHNPRAPLNPSHTLIKGVGFICGQRG